ncbi:uncharacterized protein EDB91DRAFT_1078083 [Suillus paluster]|uniref:uncharacterized protein n=1 Tax=Suillus paluster TaxID=48578 RepID=UPI001B88575D|nr:uncharacterized protein EDB91DRAFT_1078083 [Suillus paluster]KAG1751264.1 hypothetical protein EDB91DRAFT_1078083 [Suillus paluster]
MIQLVKGMRVMVTHNLATTANLSNGSQGCVADIILDVREDPISTEAIAERKVFLHYPPAMVILELDFCKLPPLPGLHPRHVPLTPVQYKFSIGSSPVTQITQHQLPLVPAYAFTDFKSQGQTIEYVLVDIGKTTCFSLSPFNVYVALSRSHGQESIRLLRDFNKDLFLRHPSKDLHIEDGRIDELVKDTKKCFDETHHHTTSIKMQNNLPSALLGTFLIAETQTRGLSHFHTFPCCNWLLSDYHAAIDITAMARELRGHPALPVIILYLVNFCSYTQFFLEDNDIATEILAALEM